MNLWQAAGMWSDAPSPDLRLSRRRWLAWGAAVPMLPACVVPPSHEPDAAPATRTAGASLNGSPWSRAHQLPTGLGPWIHRTFPNRQPVRYEPVPDWHGRPALKATAAGANSLIHLEVRRPVAPGTRWAFGWWAQALNPQADITDPQRNDVVLRWTLSFDGDRATFTRRDHTLSELALLMTGEPLPHATLMYVWDPRHPVGSVLPHPHTSRIRHLVVQSGEGGLGRWNEHERDLHADFQAAFGERPGSLLGVGAFTNSNNTAHRSEGWYGPVALG